MICFFSSCDSIEVSPVEPMIRTAAVPWVSWNFSSVRKAAKSTEPSLLNGVIRATNEPVSFLLDILGLHGLRGGLILLANRYPVASNGLVKAWTGATAPVQRSTSTSALKALGPWVSREVPVSRVRTLGLP